MVHRIAEIVLWVSSLLTELLTIDFTSKSQQAIIKDPKVSQGFSFLNCLFANFIFCYCIDEIIHSILNSVSKLSKYVHDEV